MVAAVAQRAAVHHREFRGGEDRFGIACPKGLHEFQLLQEGGIRSLLEIQLAFQQQGRGQGLLAQLVRHDPFEGLAEAFQLVGF